MKIEEFKIVRLSDEQILALKNGDKSDDLKGDEYITKSADAIWFALGDVGLTNDDTQALFDGKTYDEIEDLVPEDAIHLDDATLDEYESKLNQLENEGVLTWEYFISDSLGGYLVDAGAFVTPKKLNDSEWLKLSGELENIEDGAV
ncbi:hypothetical protein ACFL3W_00085 [Pseudomonadota bacterium]